MQIQNQALAPVVAIDGKARTGKGIVRFNVSKKLGFHQLDSGVLYRAVALRAIQTGEKSEARWIQFAQDLNITIEGECILLNGKDKTEEIRSLTVGTQASVVAQVQGVRNALLHFQLGKRQMPGLVADGRDQGEIFKGSYKYFLIASREVQADREFKRLKKEGRPAVYEEILEEIIRRDESDTKRSVSPLRPHCEALVIDTDPISAEKVAEIILDDYRRKEGGR